jgi:hypothetical protein
MVPHGGGFKCRSCGAEEPTAAKLCAKCEASTETKSDDGRYGQFLHVRCFDSWWRSEYGSMKGPYYRWMRGGMCVR